MKSSNLYKKIIIGIDPGVKTGLAFVDGETGNLLRVETHGILQAMQEIQNFKTVNASTQTEILIENPNKRKWFGNTGRELLQGAGSIKRDYSIWLEFFKLYGFTFTEVDPKNNRTKLRAAAFCNLTKWKGATNEHSRDAAMLVFGKRSSPDGYKKMSFGDNQDLIIEVQTAKKIDFTWEEIETKLSKPKKKAQEIKYLKGHFQEVKNQNPPSKWKKG
jgi:hypothetical protein